MHKSVTFLLLTFFGTFYKNFKNGLRNQCEILRFLIPDAGMVSTMSITCDIISAGSAERTWSNLDWSSSMPQSRNRDSTKVNQALGLVVQNGGSLMSRC
jgi:hypothetical protein